LAVAAALPVGRCGETRRPEGRPTALRNTVWAGLQPDAFHLDAAKPVGLKADPRLCATPCGSGFSPTPSTSMRRNPSA